MPYGKTASRWRWWSTPTTRPSAPWAGSGIWRTPWSFHSRHIARNGEAISPLLVGDEVEVISMAPADECSHEMFVMIRWDHGGLGVPLSQLESSGAGLNTETAVADWRYWVSHGYQF